MIQGLVWLWCQSDLYRSNDRASLVTLVGRQLNKWVYAITLAVGLLGLLYWALNFRGWPLLAPLIPANIAFRLTPDSWLMMACAFVALGGFFGLIRKKSN